MDNGKRAKGDQDITEINDLPDNVIDNILDRLPIGDAVRTSILSKKWCLHWTRLGNLVFDRAFIDDEIVGRYEEDDYDTYRFAYGDAIGTVLFLHSGPINKFHLAVPDVVDGPPNLDALVNKWMHYVSRSGVKDITLEFVTENESMPLPSYLFRCQELRRLSIWNCQGNLPSFFTGFSYLISLRLDIFSANGDELTVLISGCPLLENISLDFCKVKGPLNVSALRLETFEIKDCKLDGLTMQNVPNLVTASFGGIYISSVQPHSIETFFDPMQKIESIALYDGLFKVSDQHHIPETFPTPLNSLKHLTLFAFGKVDRVGLLFSLCILRSSPYLQTLNVCFSMFTVARDNLAATVTFCEEQFREPCYLKNIITVKMRCLDGTRAQMAFIKFILASCPALEELYVNADRTVSQTAELKIMSELNECRRASSKAKLIYSKSLGYYNVLRYSEGQLDDRFFKF